MASRLSWVGLVLLAGCPGPSGEPGPAPAGPLPGPVELASAPASNPSAVPESVPSAPGGTDAISRASPPYEAGPSVLASGEVDGAALRKRNTARLQRDLSPVTVLQGSSPSKLGARICEAVVPKVPAEKPILLKPNIGGFDWFKNAEKSGGDDGVEGRITDPEFTRGVIQCLKKRGHTNIIVAEGWGATHKDWERLVKVSGYEAMTREEGVPLVALDDDGVFDVEGDKPGAPVKISGMETTKVPTLLVPKLLAEVLDHGMFISLPKVKCHRFGVVSIALKGVQGTIMYSDASPVFRQKWRTHKELGKYLDAQKKGLPEDRDAYIKSLEVFAERIVDVFLVETPDVVLADASPAMSGDGFQALYPSAELVAIGGTNPVLVDRVGAQLLGLWENAALGKELGGHQTSPLITAAAKRLGLDLSVVEVTGDGASLLESPRRANYKAMAPFTITTAGGGTVKVVASTPAASTAPASPAPAKAAAKEASKEAARPTTSRDGKPLAYAATLGADTITLDGKGDDAAWSRAPEVAWETDYSGTSTGITTRARFLWSKDALYALFTLEATDLHTDLSFPVEVEREALFKEDCVELFLSPDPSRPKRYFEVELGPHGHWFDIDVDREARKSNTAWNSEAQIATTRDATKRRAVIEVALRARDLVAALVPGAKLPMGLYRMEGKSPRKYLAWSPPKTPKPNFHVPEAFGTLLLDF